MFKLARNSCAKLMAAMRISVVTVTSLIYRRRRYINVLHKFQFDANPNGGLYAGPNYCFVQVCFVKFICFSNVSDFIL